MVSVIVLFKNSVSVSILYVCAEDEKLDSAEVLEIFDTNGSNVSLRFNIPKSVDLCLRQRSRDHFD